MVYRSHSYQIYDQNFIFKILFIHWRPFKVVLCNVVNILVFTSENKANMALHGLLCWQVTLKLVIKPLMSTRCH